MNLLWFLAFTGILPNSTTITPNEIISTASLGETANPFVIRGHWINDESINPLQPLLQPPLQHPLQHPLQQPLEYPQVNEDTNSVDTNCVEYSCPLETDGLVFGIFTIELCSNTTLNAAPPALQESPSDVE
ncbi:hypothetical protein JCM33374_g6487 [Metschnikowia sp. JCM 33374]|nr:hypothetical protein JCM33374_g6487 [Metschnikowia sp. JCM 33374]